MSLMEVNPKPMFDTAPKIPKPLFPAAANEYASENHAPQLTDLNFVPKVENTLPGSRIVHPEDDISLVSKICYLIIKTNIPTPT